MCGVVTSSANPKCVYEGASSAANTKYVYLNLSVWSNAQSANAADTWDKTKSEFYVQFHASEWDNGDTYYADPSVAALDLTAPAAALALSASAATVLAVAFSLY